jgi:hypothetical protein
MSNEAREADEVLGPLADPVEEAFALYLAENPGHPALAAKFAGVRDSNHWRAAKILLQRAHVQARIRARLLERLNSARVHSDEIIGTLVEQMRGDIADVLDARGQFDFKKARQRGLTHIIKKHTVKEYYTKSGDRVVTTTIEIHDQGKAAERLADIFGLKSLPRTNKAAEDDLAARSLMLSANAAGEMMDYETALALVQAEDESDGEPN